MKIHLVDGTFELFRCFHGAPRATSPTGAEVGAVRGLLHTLVALLREPDVSHVAVAVDQAVVPPASPGASSEDRALPSQHALAADAIRALGLVIWPMVKRWQADDALATGAARWADAPGVEQVVLCTPDKDLAQSVRGTKVVMLDRVRKRTTDEASVVERWGVSPAQIPDLLALAGDSADGIPGLPGFGLKTAALLLRNYDTIEKIPHDHNEWASKVRGAERLARVLEERLKEVLFYRELIRLMKDVPLQETLEDLAWRGPDRAAFEAFAASLGETEVIARIPRWRT